MSEKSPISNSPFVIPFVILLVCIALLIGMIAIQPTPQKTVAAPASVALTVPFPPIPVPSTNAVNLAYELEIAPPDNQTIVPEKIEVIDPATGKIFFTATGEQLAAVYHQKANPPPTAAELQNGTAKLLIPRISLWLTVNATNVPDRLVHRLTLNRSATGLSPLVVTGSEVPVRKDLAPVVIGSPMRGPGWMAMESTAPTTHHFLGQVIMGGVPRVPQRFAQDWIYVDPVNGSAVTGNATIAKNYLGYGKEIYAVANGTVVDLLDGLPDNERIYAAPPFSVETAAGNYVIVDIGNQKYACFAHMVPGSIRVKKGDVVTEGQVIGLMGNSGNSDIPHLHFQVVNGSPTFLGAEGYPHVYRPFDVIAGINMTRGEELQSVPGYNMNMLWSSFGDLVVPIQKPISQANRLPENNAIVRFP